MNTTISTLRPTRKPGFTLVELLIVTGAIGVLSGIVLSAVNPQRQLAIANDVKREVAAREVERALERYLVDPQNQEFSITDIPTTQTKICKTGQTGDCIQLSFLEEYLSEMPVDVEEPEDSPYSGFTIERGENDWPTVTPLYYGGGSGEIGDEDLLTCADWEPVDWDDDWSVALGSGTPSDPYIVCGCALLQGMEVDLDAHYALGADIDCADTNEGEWDGEGYGFRPIGDEDTPFTGSLDGRGYTVSDLYIERPNTDYVGLFGSAPDVTVEDLNMTGVSIQGQSMVGAIGGRVNVENCTAEGTVNGQNFVGGAIGIGSADNTVATVDVTASGYTVGGLVGLVGWSGEFNAFISDSSAHGDVTAIGGGFTGNLGGLVGAFAPDMDVGSIGIQRSFATGNVTGAGTTGTSNVGGLAGLYSSYETVIQDVYATGNVETTGANIGALIGSIGDQANLRRAYASGDADGNVTGGLIGAMGDVIVENSFSVSANVQGINAEGAVVGGLNEYDGGYLDNVYWNNVAGNPENCYFSMGDINAPGDDGCTQVGNNIDAFSYTSFDVYDTANAQWDFLNVWQMPPGGLPTLR